MMLLENNVKKWISDLGWKNVTFDDAGNYARLSLVGQNGDFFITIIWNDNDDESTPNYFEIWAHCPIKVPQNKREKVAECLMILNCDRHLSHYTLDYQDGEVICRSTIYSPDSIFSDKEFLGVLNISLGGMDMAFPLITKVIYSEISVEQAIKEWVDSLK